MLSDPGCHRELNEDTAAIVIPDNQEVAALKGSLAIVADGMGGYQAGEVASRLAVETILRVYYKESSAADPGAALAEAFLAAHKDVKAKADTLQEMEGMGTTCTALVIRNSTAYISHVGDSRLYLVRDGQVYLMSEDHSVVMQMVRDGALSLEEARKHGDRNLLLQALGRNIDLKVYHWDKPFPVHPGDRFLLCSDGLHDLVDEETILTTVGGESLRQACKDLIAAARSKGGFDNITAAVLAVDGQPAAALKATREAEISA
jgi:protein phosphatase